MSERYLLPEPPPPEEKPPVRGRPLLAWFVILLVVVAVVLAQRQRGERADGEGGGQVQHNVTEMQSRYLVGA